MPHSIWWIRRDLRLADNHALQAALRRGSVVPLFVVDPAIAGPSATSPRRRAFLTRGLAALDADLRARGSRLVVREGRPARAVAGLARELGGAPVFAEEDFTPYARSRDREVASAATLELTPGLAVRHPAQLLNRDGRPFVTFRGFRRAWLASPESPGVFEAPQRLPGIPELRSADVPTAPHVGIDFESGENAGQRALERLVARKAARYTGERDRLDADGTSKLSPYLRFGMVAPARAVDRARSARSEGSSRWIDELIWRDFYISALSHFPPTASVDFAPFGRRLRWRNDLAEFESWKAGLTGYPVVDAAMRQLSATGWINRARMIVASFLVKRLLIYWRWGERWFRSQLVDGDLAANVGGWQWTAGTGPEASPYFRIFNPSLQGARFDPDGRFVRTWVPELRRTPGGAVHRVAGDVVGYPSPVVDHRFARLRALDAYRFALEAQRRSG